MSPKSLPERWYQRLLDAAPYEFREAHGREATETLRDLYRETLRTRGRWAATVLWVRSICGLTLCIVAEQWEPDRLMRDIRFSFRSFRRSPGFSLAAILILGTGIGATTAIFSVVDTVMLRPLSYPEPGRLVAMGYGGERPMLYVRWRDHLRSFEALGAVWNNPVDLTSGESPARLNASRVTPDFLPLLGATPYLGRLLMRDDYQGDASVALLGFGAWQRKWGGDPSIVGRQIQLNGRPVVVAGILSPAFEPPEAITGSAVDIWLPLDVEEEESLGWSVLGVVGRLERDVALGVAQAEMDALTESLASEMPGVLVRQDGSLRQTRLVPLHIATIRGVALVLLMLFAAVGLLLLIACANVANLLLARGTTRAREMALRGALGAGRSRIVRQLLTESVCLGVVGGLLGVALAYASVAGFIHLNPGGVPRIHNLAVDTRVLFFALFASMSTGILFGLFPVVQAVRKNVSDALAETASSTTPTHRGRLIRSGLVVTEIALALILLTGAGLFFRSMVAMTQVEPGFESAQLVTIPLRLGPHYSDAARRQFADDVFERIRAIPGTDAVAAGITVPFEFTGSSKCCIWNEIRGETASNQAEPIPMVMIHPITPGYFATLGTPISFGREFAPDDLSGDGQVVVINAPLARYFFGTEDVVGRTIQIGNQGSYTVVGVVPGVHHWGIVQGTPPGVYVSYAQWGSFADRLHLLVRSRANVQALAPALREAVASVDPSLPVAEIVPMDQRVSASLAGHRFLSFLLGSFAVVALTLAAGGIYASMLYMVGQRRAEMGIRSALGATKMNLTALVLKNGLLVTAIGTGIGVAGSVAASRLIGKMVSGISAIAPMTIAGVALLLGAVALCACVIPAHRAASTDPLQTLKSQ